MKDTDEWFHENVLLYWQLKLCWHLTVDNQGCCLPSISIAIVIVFNNHIFQEIGFLLTLFIVKIE